MRLLPAIDILDGCAVRLVRGDFDESTVYDADPLSAAAGWVDDGARRLHIVDLDGARRGAPVNLHQLARITDALDVPVQFGGGLRSREAIDAALEAGAERVILGTAALRDPALLAEALSAHGADRVLVSLDVRGGRPATAGWTESDEAGTGAALQRLTAAGVTRLVYTNVDRDGMLEGADVEEVRALLVSTDAAVVYSGGIGSLQDLRALAGLAGLDGVIVGKALYEGRFTVAEAREVLGD